MSWLGNILWNCSGLVTLRVLKTCWPIRSNEWQQYSRIFCFHEKQAPFRTFQRGFLVRIFLYPWKIYSLPHFLIFLPLAPFPPLLYKIKQSQELACKWPSLMETSQRSVQLEKNVMKRLHLVWSIFPDPEYSEHPALAVKIPNTQPTKATHALRDVSPWWPC